MTWAKRFQRVVAIDLETGRRCGGQLRVSASSEAPAVIVRILAHCARDPVSVDPAHPSRAPPVRKLLI
jgi:hypothetical protein